MVIETYLSVQRVSSCLSLYFYLGSKVPMMVYNLATGQCRPHSGGDVEAATEGAEGTSCCVHGCLGLAGGRVQAGGEPSGFPEAGGTGSEGGEVCGCGWRTHRAFQVTARTSGKGQIPEGSEWCSDPRTILMLWISVLRFCDESLQHK